MISDLDFNLQFFVIKSLIRFDSILAMLVKFNCVNLCKNNKFVNTVHIKASKSIPFF